MSEQATSNFELMFRGRKDAWGSVAGAANKEPVTRQHYQDHLDGKVSLGIYPLMDDGKIKFFAIDIDEQDPNKPLALRQRFRELNMPVYMARSKSKGYHVYGFLFQTHKAFEIRQIIKWVLHDVGFNAEIFPKQDSLDGGTTLGNYINLPGFGDKRPFIDVNLRPLPIEDVLTGATGPTGVKGVTRLVAIKPDVLKKALDTMPAQFRKLHEPATKVKSGITKGSRLGKKIKEPCLIQILKGVAKGKRDEAAFALALHFLEEGYMPDEVLDILAPWNSQNNPPMDERDLLTKIRSAEKGYGFGCSSINRGVLSEFCVGEDQCKAKAAADLANKKSGKILVRSFFEDEEYLYEELAKWKDGFLHPSWLAYELKTGKMHELDKIEYGERIILPWGASKASPNTRARTDADEAFGDDAMLHLPEAATPYGSPAELIDRIRKHILSMVDFGNDHKQKDFDKWAAYYILLTWVSDRMTTIPYLRFLGDTGCGKSRALDVIGRLCYKPMSVSGVVTSAITFRLIERWRGTLIIEEADFRKSDESNDMVTILNCGYERGKPVMRCNNLDPNIFEVLPCFGPKIFATRKEWKDSALESRCFTVTMTETRRQDIPWIANLATPARQKRNARAQEEMEIRNQLLMFRFEHRNKIDPDKTDAIDLGASLEPRMKQMSLPFSLTFADVPEVLEEFKEWMIVYGERQREIRHGDDITYILEAILNLTSVHGKGALTSTMISKFLEEHRGALINAKQVGRLLRMLQINATKARRGGRQERWIEWDTPNMETLCIRYGIDMEDYADLFGQTLTPHDTEI